MPAYDLRTSRACHTLAPEAAKLSHGRRQLIDAPPRRPYRTACAGGDPPVLVGQRVCRMSRTTSASPPRSKRRVQGGCSCAPCMSLRHAALGLPGVPILVFVHRARGLGHPWASQPLRAPRASNSKAICNAQGYPHFSLAITCRWSAAPSMLGWPVDWPAVCMACCG